MEYTDLIRAALAAREKAYTPYSGFQVGAALLTESSTVYTGCNIENAAFSPSNCAERTAFFKAVSEGDTHFVAIAVVGGRGGSAPAGYCAPCGVCRQVMAEFCNSTTFKIILAKSPEEYKIYQLSDLLPESFSPDDLR